MTTRMTTIAEELGTRYRTRATLSQRKRELDQEAEIKRLYITPPDGWPGKNAEQRDAAKLTAELQDETLIKINDALEILEDEASANSASIDALEAERRALEWEIRERLVDALSWNHVQTEVDTKVEVTAFDDAADAKALHNADLEAVLTTIEAEEKQQPEAPENTEQPRVVPNYGIFY